MGNGPLPRKTVFAIEKIGKHGLAPLCEHQWPAKQYPPPYEFRNTLPVYINGNVWTWNELLVTARIREKTLRTSSAEAEFDLRHHFNKLGNERFEKAKAPYIGNWTK